MIQNAIKDTFDKLSYKDSGLQKLLISIWLFCNIFPDISIILYILNNCNGSFFLKIFLQNLNVMLSLQTILFLGFLTSI